jgi:transcriptional regulator with XRE-family HTH domain
MAESKATNSDKFRQLSQQQMNAIGLIMEGKSDRAVAEAVGVTRQTVNEWRNRDVIFIAALNKERQDLWREARERLKSLTGQAVDVLGRQLESNDPKIALAAARHILQVNNLLGGMDAPKVGLTDPEAIIMERLRSEARIEVTEEYRKKNPYSSLDIDPFSRQIDSIDLDRQVEDLAKRRLKAAVAEAGLLEN